ncbi:hypothetical protein STAL104432_28415 [Streptomyces albus]
MFAAQPVGALVGEPAGVSCAALPGGDGEPGDAAGGHGASAEVLGEREEEPAAQHFAAAHGQRRDAVGAQPGVAVGRLREGVPGEFEIALERGVVGGGGHAGLHQPARVVK